MKTLVAIPCMDMIPTVTVKSLLGLNHDGVDFSFTMNSLVYDARNVLAKKACEDGYDRVMWIDSDMVFDADLYDRLSARLNEGMDFITGLYFSRREPIEPIIYSDVILHEEDNKYTPEIIEFMDYPKDSLFEIKGCGFGGCMMTTKMILDIATKFGLPFSPVMGFGEDVSFCMKATQAGYKLYCDSSIKLGHVGHCIVTEENFKGGLKR